MSDQKTEKRFVHLHNHSYYSLLDGLSSPTKLVEAAVENGFKALAITDHGSCGGIYVFQKACKDKGIKPILGDEIYITKDMKVKDKFAVAYHLIILAKNSQGIKNLMNLASLGEIEGKYRNPRIDFELLKKYHEGLICTTACSGGELAVLMHNDQIVAAEELVRQYKEVFGDDYYIEVMRHKYHDVAKDQEKKEYDLSIKLYQLGKKMGVKVIATNDAHFAKRSDSKYHNILLSIQTHDTIKNPNRFAFHSDEFYIKSYEEMYEIFKDMPEVLENTMEIADKIEQDLLKKNDDLLPVFIVPQGFSDEVSYLKELVKDGMKSRGFINNKEYRDRIKFEMNSIITCGYVRYFLILWDIINFAKQENIRVGIGRGSAVGSLCLYVLGITKIDPLKYGLLFERFINPDRISPPDVDVDFDYYRRDEIFRYIERKYGRNYCCKIGTYNSLKARAVIRYVSKALDLGNDWEAMQESLKKNPNAKIEEFKNSLAIADYIAKLVPKLPDVTVESSLKESEEFREAMKRHPELLECALHAEKTLNSAGVHPAGIVICKNQIVDYIPMRESKGQICSQFVGSEVEDLGLLKFDFLALKTLTVIESTLKMIKDRHGKIIDIDNLEPNDRKVFGLFNGSIPNMDNRGIFQFESTGISKLVKNIKIDKLDDLIVANALYRPGPLKAGVPDLYCDYKHGRKKIVYLHPKMGEILKDSYGTMIFQEDFMKVSQVLALFTKGQSDTLRKIVGKKKPELIKKEHLDEKFIEGCRKNGITEDIAKEVFKQIEFFGGYGFNKSHSSAYSYLAYQTAWLKVYYPIEFMCNLLSSEIDNSDKNEKLNTYFKEAERMKIVVMNANINHSKLKFVIEKGISANTKEPCEFIRSPFTIVDGIGQVAAEIIIDGQPYTDLKDFLARINGSKVTTKVFQSLLNHGAMDESWHTRRAEILAMYDSVKNEISKERTDKKKQEEYIKDKGDESLGWMFGGNSDVKL